MQRDKASSAGHFQWREGLTPKQARFIEEYLVDLNATQAALRSGYSKKTAYHIAHENLQKPEIAAALEAARQELSERTEITIERVLRGFETIAWGKNAKDADKLVALTRIGQHLGMFPTKVVHSGRIGVDVRSATDAELDHIIAGAGSGIGTQAPTDDSAGSDGLVH